MNTVCLVMIVKDEAERLPRCLDSVLPYVDRVMILDTGSKDGTVRVAEERLNMWDPSGENWNVGDTDFENFSQARNTAASHGELIQPTAYQILLDADMTLSGDVTALQHCTKDLGLVQVQDVGGSTYWLPLLRRLGCGLWYEGRTHETIQMFEGNYERIEGVLVTHHADGGARADKFERDLRLLDEDLAENPANTRAAFYRAQTLRCLGRHCAAIEAYHYRISLGGWDEEIWYSHLQMARSMRALDDAKATATALLAYNLRPSRAEPLADLARWAREDDMPAVAELFDLAAGRVPWPCADLLFVEPSAWSEGAEALYRSAVKQERWAQALAAAATCIKRGRPAFGHWAKATTLWHLGHQAAALQEAERALQLDSENPNLRADLAVMRGALDGRITAE